MAATLGSDVGILYRLISLARRRQLFLVALLMPLTAVAEMAMVAAIVPFLALLSGRGAAPNSLPLLSDLLDQLERLTPTNPLLAAAALFALAALAAAAMRLALSWMSQQFAFGFGHELSVEIHRRLLHQPYLFHLQHHSSELLSALDKVDFIIFNLVLQIFQAVSAALISIFVIAVLVRLDPLSAALAAVLIGGLYSLTLLATRRRLKGHANLISSAYEQRLKSVQESLGGIRDLILDRSQAMQVEHFRNIDERFMRARAETAFLVASPRFIVEALGLILIALLAVTIAGRPGGFIAALPILGALALGAQRLLPLASQLYIGWANLAVSRPIIAEMARLASLPVSDDGDMQVAPLPFTNAIQLEGVSFHYSDRIRPAVHEVSLAIPCGSRVAIIGKTGSGKSTLADLLMGLIEPSEGRISIDDVMLSGEQLNRWRRSIAHVPQAIFLADATIADNIALGVPGTEPNMERVRQAAEIAQLADFIDTLGDGYDTEVGERGVRLSGGQRQRLGLARAIYKNAPVLLLDEATSALDDATEAALLDALDELGAEGRTVIIIAHRRSTIDGCDLVLRLDQGRLVESGSYDQLFGEKTPTRRS
jgi:ABC-type multidrug transport system fused ATPase/permease subunit